MSVNELLADVHAYRHYLKAERGMADNTLLAYTRDLERYAGWVADEALFVGGGGYWLANRSGGRRMAYGGFVMQWLARSNDRVGFGAKALIGGGQATLTDTFTQLIRVPAVPPSRQTTTRQVTSEVRVRDEFFVVEPELDARVRLTKSIRLTGGIGYRLIGGDRRDDTRLRGAVGSLALQIGGGF